MSQPPADQRVAQSAAPHTSYERTSGPSAPDVGGFDWFALLRSLAYGVTYLLLVTSMGLLGVAAIVAVRLIRAGWLRLRRRRGGANQRESDGSRVLVAFAVEMAVLWALLAVAWLSMKPVELPPKTDRSGVAFFARIRCT